MRTTIFVDDNRILIRGNFNPAEPRTMDHPGCEAYTEIENILINGKQVDIEELASIIDYSIENTTNLVHEAIAEAYYDEHDERMQNEIDWDIDNIIESKYF